MSNQQQQLDVPVGVQIDTPVVVGALVLGALAVLVALRTGFAGALVKI